ncbi:MAG TPA: sulfopyruvate decarboxylase subunit alpha [Thermodesulfovibrionales bacterium]|jgi:sulfopyruvate decarboxylase subunit beta|nr:sulfopyruvate decarboxylase subunit alpha [Thermodesulfovibrionales bacterium]
MGCPEEELITILKSEGVDFTCSLPCEKIKELLGMVAGFFFHVSLTREEEGVGICAGAALSGKRPSIFVQSSGIGNMMNALLSLTGFYTLPLAIFVSRRGVYKERIEAQVPMGSRLPMILKAAGMPYSIINRRDDFGKIVKNLAKVYEDNAVHVFLLSPRIWEGASAGGSLSSNRGGEQPEIVWGRCAENTNKGKPVFRRFEILKIIAPYLESHIVVTNLGFPSKELFHIKHQPSNFYMLGSMGMATPIGLGIALASKKQVVVIDGDGSILMNPGSLATAAHCAPQNLTILAIDNGSYGSTGNQPTLTRSCVDLELVARGFGIGETRKVFSRKEITDIMKKPCRRLRFIHALALPGNEDVPNIPIDHFTVKQSVQGFLRSG